MKPMQFNSGGSFRCKGKFFAIVTNKHILSEPRSTVLPSHVLANVLSNSCRDSIESRVVLTFLAVVCEGSRA